VKPYLRLPSSEIAKFRANVHRVARETGTDCGVVMRSSMQQMVGMLSGYTYPRKRGDGEGAIKTDVRKLTLEVTGNSPRTKDEAVRLLVLLRLPVNQANIIAARKLVSEHGTSGQAFYSITNQQADKLPELHRQARGRGGRVARGVIVKIGDVTANRLRIRAEQQVRHMQQVFHRVGRLRGGWNKAAEVWRAKVADWAWRHGTAEGAATDALKPDGSGFLRATNNVPYAYPKLKGLTTIAMRAAIRNVEKRLKRIAAKSRRV